MKPHRIISVVVSFLIGLALAHCTAPAQAEPVTVGVHIGSVHLPARYFNNVNPGLYVRQGDWQAGVYRNSYRHTTAYVARAWPITERLELATGVATGYRDAWDHGPLAPMAAFSYRFDGGVRISFLPPTPKTSAVVHLSKEF